MYSAGVWTVLLYPVQTLVLPKFAGDCIGLYTPKITFEEIKWIEELLLPHPFQLQCHYPPGSVSVSNLWDLESWDLTLRRTRCLLTTLLPLPTLALLLTLASMTRTQRSSWRGRRRRMRGRASSGRNFGLHCPRLVVVCDRWPGSGTGRRWTPSSDLVKENCIFSEFQTTRERDPKVPKDKSN